MSKKGENVYKRKDERTQGRYVRFYDEHGKAKCRYVYARSYTETKKRTPEKLSVSVNKADISVGSSATYGTVLDYWLQSSRIKIKESTYARYFHLIETHIRPSLGKYRLSMINAHLIEGFIEQKLVNGRLDESGPLSPKTVTDILTIIKSSIEYARYNDMGVICNLSKLSIKKREKEMRVLCQDEQNALLKVLLNNTDLYKFGVLLSLYMGIRIGELCALRWEDLDLNASTLRIRKTMQRIQNTDIAASPKTKIIITVPKSQCSIRDIPIPDCIIKIAKQFSCPAKAFILTGDKNKYVEPRTMQNHFRSYVTESGINSANFHSLRHTFATRCVEAGFELKSLSEILGHSNVNITLNRYVHSSFDLKHNNMNKLTLLA